MVKKIKRGRTIAAARKTAVAVMPAHAPISPVTMAPVMTPTMTIVDGLRNSWFLILFVGTVIYWAARHDSSLNDIKRIDTRTTMLEGRVSTLESGLGQMQSKLDAIKEDVTLIKRAVIK
ncbi:MAG: hypothetical protein FWC51_03125 [Proteobacteria bacterium]|nr:hypothetical protein [Pseudomonadota bacterium]